MSRTKGSLNKDKGRAFTKFRHHSFDPIDEMIVCAKEAKERGDTADLFDMCKELAQYAYPKLKSIEHSLDDATQSALIVNGTAGLPIADQPTSEAATDAGVTRH